MDKALNQRWTEALPPFDGYALVFDESLHKIVGTAVVRFLFAELDLRFGLNDELYINKDWHVHDGFIKESDIVLKADLVSQLAAQPDKWICVIEYQVYWGVYDSTFRFYLRFGLEEDDPTIASIDLTSDENTVRELAAKVRSLFNIEVEIVQAKSFFDRIYGG